MAENDRRKRSNRDHHRQAMICVNRRASNNIKCGREIQPGSKSYANRTNDPTPENLQHPGSIEKLLILTSGTLNHSLAQSYVGEERSENLDCGSDSNDSEQLRCEQAGHNEVAG